MSKDKSKNQVFIKIETTSLTTDAAIPFIGACVFDPMQFRPEPIGELRLALDWLSQECFDNRRVCEETMKFWETRPTIAQELLEGKLDASKALIQLNAFIQQYATSDAKIWFQCSAFDVPILNELYAALNLKPAWKRWNVMCHQTARNTFNASRGQLRTTELDIKKNPAEASTVLALDVARCYSALVGK